MCGGHGSIILSNVQMPCNATRIGDHGVAISITDMGKAIVAKEITLVIRKTTCQQGRDKGHALMLG
jgi:hypothetical protein